MNEESVQEIEHRIERLDASIDRTRSEWHRSVTAAGRRQMQDNIDRLKYERHQLAEKLSEAVGL